ncbi:SpoIIE family protein phosphatase [Undibacterium sp. Ji83W]|uniref:SpoIIE family protein phosphatase n=1 Tax=Undibacterium sp. Ji83W TaxID=3413043 RepID=UPI003BF2BFB9
MPSTTPPVSNNKKNNDINFFRNYNRLVGFTYIAIVVLTMGFFLFQIRQKHTEEIKVIQGHVDRHGQFVEFILRSSLDSLEAMRISAANFYDSAPPVLSEAETHPGHSPLFKTLEQEKQSFDLDKAQEKDATGNLNGLGKLQSRTPEFYLDVEMALNLNQVFQAIAFNLPNASESRFISVDNFSNTYPWMDAAKRPHSDKVYQSQVWLMGTPEKNPTGEKYWAPVYYGGTASGLLVPTAAPIYHDDKFRGVVSIDTSLDYLNRINADFAYKPGTAFLVDAYGEVVAHPEAYANALEVQATQRLEKIMPAGILTDGKRLTDIPANQAVEMGDYLLIRHPFISAPWQLVYVVPKYQLWKNLLWERGPIMLLVILGLTLLMIVTYYVTTREFISPASKLVAHIAKESQFTPAPIPVVPGTWKPWFETISQAFKQSLQLVSIRQELDIAANMQLSILPRHWPNQKEFSLWGIMRSAKEVGGDFYDHFSLGNGKTGIVVADVSGKGVPAALFGMVSKTLIRATATRNASEPGEIIAIANDILAEDNDECIFVTTFYAVLDPATGMLTYVNGGHPPPLLIHQDGTTEFLPMTGGSALGIMDGIPFAQKTVQLQAGDYVLIYTDGVTEAFNPQNEEYTPDRLPPLFENRPIADVNEAVNRTVADVDLHANGAPQSDDITCVALHFHFAKNSVTDNKPEEDQQAS